MTITKENLQVLAKEIAIWLGIIGLGLSAVGIASF